MNAEQNYIGKPVRSLQSMLAVIASQDGQIRGVIPDGVYGKQTKSSVFDLQKAAKMRATGEVNHATWNEIVSRYYAALPQAAPAAPLSILWQPGQVIVPEEENTHLYPIQSMLAAIAKTDRQMPPLTITGRHDAQSVEAVLWLQALCGLPQSGLFGAEEWLHLTKLYSLLAGDGTFSL